MSYFKIHTQESLIRIEWLDLIDSIEYRRAHMSFLAEMEANSYLLWLLNYKQGKDILLEDHEWTMGEWLPKALELMQDVEKIAVVVPDNIFNRISMRILTSQILAQKDVAMAFFQNEEEAKTWLIPADELVE